MTAYYNEFDPYAAHWLRNLIAAGHLPAGEVDERSIADVDSDDLAGFTQCHFFAGIGGWSHALRLAGWDDARPVWTGSAPCQPFSAAGKQQGATDARHLWPEMFRLVRECRPAIVFGEQVEAAVRHGWLDGVCGDLEGEGYACGAHVLGAHSAGAPHIRQRLFWVADASDGRRQYEPHGGPSSVFQEMAGAQERGEQSGGRGASIRGLADAENANGRRGERAAQAGIGQDGERGRGFGERGLAGWLADLRGTGLEGRDEGTLGHQREAVERSGGAGFWSDADWIPCTDGKARRVEPGTFPLAHGVSNRVGRLRAYGNAIVPQVAAEFIKCAAAETPE